MCKTNGPGRQCLRWVAKSVGLLAGLCWIALLRADAEGSETATLATISAASKASLTGPTLNLNYGSGDSPGNPLLEFMYFVPLIAPEPVAISQSPGNTQRARVISTKRRFVRNKFFVTYQYEFVGAGDQRNAIDHSEKIRRNERALKAGRPLDEQLESINITGGGYITVEADGAVEGSTTNVTEVRLSFNARGQQSPVTIGIHDLKWVDGHVVSQNEVVARVNSLTFKRQPGEPRMELSIASVKPKDAPDSLWQNFVGRVKGGAATLFIKPIVIRPVGNQAMLDFGQALVSQAPVFTFPLAANLVTARP